MPVPTSIGQLSTNAASNYPLGSEQVFPNMDDYLRAHASFIAQLNAALSGMAGMIVLWSGSVASIPAGWALCDGTNGTPNLADRFVVAAGRAYAPWATGGADTQGTNMGSAGGHSHGGAVGYTAITESQMPPHIHSISIAGSGDSSGGPGYGFIKGSTNNTVSSLTAASAGGGSGHTHTISADGSHTHGITNWDNRPSYYALCYIMKLPS